MVYKKLSVFLLVLLANISLGASDLPILLEDDMELSVEVLNELPDDIDVPAGIPSFDDIIMDSEKVEFSPILLAHTSSTIRYEKAKPSAEVIDELEKKISKLEQSRIGLEKLWRESIYIDDFNFFFASSNLKEIINIFECKLSCNKSKNLFYYGELVNIYGNRFQELATQVKKHCEGPDASVGPYFPKLFLTPHQIVDQLLVFMHGYAELHNRICENIQKYQNILEKIPSVFV